MNITDINICIKEDINDDKNIKIKSEKYKPIFSSWHSIKKNIFKNCTVGLVLGFFSGLYSSDIVLGLEFGFALGIICTLIR
jgi:hypothetical protein